jgi:hypothetical protein
VVLSKMNKKRHKKTRNQYIIHGKPFPAARSK